MRLLVLGITLSVTSLVGAGVPQNVGISHPPAREQTPMEREFHAPATPEPRLSESVPFPMSSRSRNELDAFLQSIPFRLTMPLGHAVPRMWGMY